MMGYRTLMTGHATPYNIASDILLFTISCGSGYNIAIGDMSMYGGTAIAESFLSILLWDKELYTLSPQVFIILLLDTSSIQ